MKLVLVSLAAVAAAARIHDKRDLTPTNTLPVQPPGDETATSATSHTLTIMPIISFTPDPTDSASNKVTIPETSLPSSHPTIIVPHPSTSPITSDTMPGGGIGTDSSSDSATSRQDSTQSTATESTAPASSSSSSTSVSTSQTGSTQTMNAAATPTANMLAGIAAIAGLAMIA